MNEKLLLKVTNALSEYFNQKANIPTNLKGFAQPLI